ncbi:MFS transporter [Gleimia hominis]|uniref:MFS transporter n=1 Tax=Gleimia hominis TaxID=595468 RepID=UPI000C7FF69C|nr:MFS transporter [Gleimia hominis]WIK63803.1 MFS transporter [Gleimia hominis]
MSSTFASLKFFNYRLWFGANIVASSAMWMQRVAQDWVVLTVLTNGSGTALGIVTALQFIPTLLFSPWAGLIADRMNLRRVVQLCQSLNGIMSLILGILILTNTAQLWHVYVLAFISGIIGTIDSPARQTFVSELVPLKFLPNAVGLNSAAFNVARLIGPAISGLVIEWVGPGWVFVVNFLLFFGPVIGILLMRLGELHEIEHVPHEKHQIRKGFRYVRKRTDIVVIMIVAGIVSAFGMNFQMTSAVMATDVFGKGAGEYGILGSFMAVGALIGALLAARRKYPRVRLVVIAAVLFGMFNILLGIAPTYATFAILAVPTGLAMLTMVTAANAAIQVSTDPQMRGRVMSLYLMVYLGANPIGAPIIGWIADVAGGRWALIAGGLISITVAVICGLWAVHSWDVRVKARFSRHPIIMYGPRERAEDRRRRLEEEKERKQKEAQAQQQAESQQQAQDNEQLRREEDGQPQSEENGQRRSEDTKEPLDAQSDRVDDPNDARG